jgi:hypothetical protein
MSNITNNNNILSDNKEGNNNKTNNVDINNNLSSNENQQDKNIIKPNKFQGYKLNNNNLFSYNQLKNKLSTITNENIKLKADIISLNNKIISLESDKVCQRQTINDLKNTQNDLLSLKPLIKEKEQIIQSLKEQIISDHKKFNEEFRYRESKYDYELIQSKIQYESAKYKIENYLKIENYSDALYKKVLEMEEIINNFNELEEKAMNKKKMEYLSKLNKFKKKMLDFLKEETNSKKNLNKQLQLNNILNNLHINELIKDVEDLNNEVCNLLEEKQELKYKIFCLVNDNKIYRRVVDTVCLKNNYLKNRLFKNRISPSINHFDKFFYDKEKVPKETVKNHREVRKKLNTLNIKTNNKLMKISNSLSFIYDKFNDKKKMNFYTPNISLNKFNSTTNYNTVRSSNINDSINNYKKSKELIDKQILLIKENENFKNYYEYYKNKYNLLIEKYSSIFKIYNEALEKIFKEDLCKDNNDIYINLNNFSNFNFDFDKMNSNEKYFILVKLIKHIAPLICKKELENNILSKEIFKIREKYSLDNNNIKSLNFSTEQNSFEISSPFRNRYKTMTKNNNLIENKSTGSLKIIDKKHKKLKDIIGKQKNKQKIFLEFKKYFNIKSVDPLKSIPINHFYNGPFGDI